MFCLGPFRVLRDRRLERQGAAGGGTLPPFLSLPPTRRGVMVTPRPNAPRARVRGRPTSPSGRSSGFAGGFFQFIISTAVSVRARWKKGQGAAEGKLLSQLSFSVYAGQVVFRSALQQSYDRGAWRHRGVSLMSLFFARVMFCHVFSVSSWELFVIVCRR